VQKLVCPRVGVSNLTFSPDGDMLAGIGPGALYCWTRSRDWEQSGLRHPNHIILTAAFHPGGRTLAYALIPARIFTPVASPGPMLEGFAGVKLYSLTSEAEFEPDLLPITGPVNSTHYREVWLTGLTFTPDGRMLLANRAEERGLFSTSQVILHWPFTPSGTGWRVPETPNRSEPVNGAALFESTSLILTGQWGICVCTLDSGTSAPLQVPDLSRATGVVTSQRGELVAATGDGKLQVWNLREPHPIAAWSVPPVPTREAFAMAFAPDGRTLAISSTNRIVTFYDPFTGQCRAEYNFGVGGINSLAFASDGLTLAVAGHLGLVVVDTE
jgi:WD40 repeat protein